jgi:hypothetical protein
MTLPSCTADATVNIGLPSSEIMAALGRDNLSITGLIRSQQSFYRSKRPRPK